MQWLFSLGVQKPLSTERSPSPLSSRAKPRDLQSRGPLLETRNTILKQNCHLDRSVPGFPATQHSETTAYAAFSKESRRKFANATNANRKSGVAQWRDLRFSFSSHPDVKPLACTYSCSTGGKWASRLIQAKYHEPRERVCVCCHRIAPRQSRHPERSASRIYRKQSASWRGVEGPRRCLLADALANFPAAN